MDQAGKPSEFFIGNAYIFRAGGNGIDSAAYCQRIAIPVDNRTAMRIKCQRTRITGHALFAQKLVLKNLQKKGATQDYAKTY